MIDPATQVVQLVGFDEAGMDSEKTGYSTIVGGRIVRTESVDSADSMVHIWIDNREQLDVLLEAMHTVHILGKTVVLHSLLPSAAQVIALAADETAKRTRQAILEDWCESGVRVGRALADVASGNTELAGLMPSEFRGDRPSRVIVDEVDNTAKRTTKASRKAARPRWRQ